MPLIRDLLHLWLFLNHVGCTWFFLVRFQYQRFHFSADFKWLTWIGMVRTRKVTPPNVAVAFNFIQLVNYSTKKSWYYCFWKIKLVPVWCPSLSGDVNKRTGFLEIIPKSVWISCHLIHSDCTRFETHINVWVKHKCRTIISLSMTLDVKVVIVWPLDTTRIICKTSRYVNPWISMVGWAWSVTFKVAIGNAAEVWLITSDGFTVVTLEECLFLYH